MIPKIRILLFSLLFFSPLNGLAEEKFEKVEEKTAVEKKAENIVIPSVEFADTPIHDALDFLVQRSRELDVDEDDSQKRGINVLLVGDFRETRISMRLTQVPLDATLEVLADMVDARLEARSEILVINRDFPYDVFSRQEDSVGLDAKMKEIVLPSVEFQDTPVSDAVDFLQQRSVELDAENDGARKCVNLVVKNSEELGNVSFRLRNVSLYSALEVLAMAIGYQVEIREHLVFLRPRVDPQGGARARRALPPPSQSKNKR